MSNALFKHLLTSNSSDIENNSNVTYDDYVPITTYIMPLISKPTNVSIDISTLLGGILFPFAASFLIPVSVCCCSLNVQLLLLSVYLKCLPCIYNCTFTSLHARIILLYSMWADNYKYTCFPCTHCRYICPL